MKKWPFRMPDLKPIVATLVFAVGAGGSGTKALAQAVDPFLGQIIAVGFNFCPIGWAKAEGQILAVNENQALFALYGTMYGGDGRTTFALPDLRGRGPIGVGQGPGLPNYRQGQRGGSTSVTLSVNQMPPHSHSVNVVGKKGTKLGAPTDFLAITNNNNVRVFHNGPPDRVMDPGVIAPTGGGASVPTSSPYLALTWCVAIQGVFPSRN